MTGSSVVPFERPQRPAGPPALSHVEVKFIDSNCSIVLTVYDSDGQRFALDYSLAWAPPEFDLNRLRLAWPQWRGRRGPAA